MAVFLGILPTRWRRVSFVNKMTALLRILYTRCDELSLRRQGPRSKSRTDTEIKFNSEKKICTGTTYTYIHTNLYSVKNRVNESETQNFVAACSSIRDTAVRVPSNNVRFRIAPTNRVMTPARVVVPRARIVSGNGVSPCARRSTSPCMQLVMCRKENFLKINDCSLLRVRVGVRVKG